MAVNKEELKAVRMRLREKYRREGYEGLSEHERLSLLLSYSVSGDFTEMADMLLKRYGSLTAVMDADAVSLQKYGGADEKTALLIKLVPCLGCILSMDEEMPSRLDTAERAVSYFVKLFTGAVQEQLAAVCFDKRLNIISSRIIASGSEISVSSSLRDIAEYAFLCRGEYIFLAHNHPFGSAEHSEADMNATVYLSEKLAQLDITLIDHIVVDKGCGASLCEAGCSIQKSESLPAYKYKTDRR